jgi:hypothetical protein
MHCYCHSCIVITYRQLYWCDWELEAIYTAAYDGTGLVAIVSSPGSWVYDIALDLQGKNLDLHLQGHENSLRLICFSIRLPHWLIRSDDILQVNESTGRTH